MPLDSFSEKKNRFSNSITEDDGYKVYGFDHASKGFITSLVMGPKYFKHSFSDSLYRYDDILKIKKTFYSPDPHPIGHILGYLIGKLVPRLIIKMKDGNRIRIDYYITRKDLHEFIDELQPTHAFLEIEAFLKLKMNGTT